LVVQKRSRSAAADVCILGVATVEPATFVHAKLECSGRPMRRVEPPPYILFLVQTDPVFILMLQLA